MLELDELRIHFRVSFLLLVLRLPFFPLMDFLALGFIGTLADLHMRAYVQIP